MTREISFWRNAAIIGLAHLFVLVGIARWSGAAKKPVTSDVVWMGAAAATDASPAPAEESIPNPPPPAAAEPEPTEQPEAQQETPPPMPTASEIQLPEPTATATATPSATPRPKSSGAPKHSPTPKPKASPHPKTTPKPTPKKTLLVKATPRPSAAPAETPRAHEETAAVSIAPASGSAGAAAGAASGAARASQFDLYGNMLHDRFFGGWVQPKTAVPTGSKMSTLVQLRIEKDGRISDFAIVRSSGNVIVDESVAAVGKRVTKVDPLPAALAGTGHYDVKINFELAVDD